MANVALSYDDNGNHAARSFVFVHGWTCDRSFFAPQYAHFGQTARAVAVDLRGHGKSPTADDGDYSIDAFAADIAALVDDLGIGRAVLVGHSLGGLISCATAAQYPDKVQAVVMVDPAPLVVSDRTREAFVGLYDDMRGADGAAVRRAFVDMMFIPTDDTTRRAEITASMSTVPADVALPTIGGVFDFDGSAALAAVQCPIAVIQSEVALNNVKAMQAVNPKLLAGQTLGAGHFNQLEVPDQVNAMIEQFLRVTL